MTTRKWTKRMKKLTVPILTEYEKGWLSAAINGEGCLSIIKNRGMYKPSLLIVNTSIKFLAEILKIVKCGGITKLYKPKGYKQCYILHIHDRNNLEGILLQVNLIAKAKQQKIMLQVIKLLDKRRQFESYSEIDALYKQMKELNKRGDE